MKTMTDKQLRELKECIWTKVLGWSKWREEEYPHRLGWAKDNGEGEKRLDADMDDPTTDPGAAMAVLEKCGEKETITLGVLKGKWCVTKATWSGLFVEAETLPIAICLFARKLFGKEGV